MKLFNKSLSPLCLAATMAVALATAGCSTVSNVSAQGTTEQPVFPDPASASFKNGSWPNVENLRQVQAGMTKDELYNLLDRPHFAEGFGPREWDYLFHFKTAQGERVCQYKVLFDSKKLARSFYWKPADCAQVLEVAAPAVKVIQVPVQQPAPPLAVSERRFTLNGDFLFGFNSAQLTPAGREQVKQLAANIKQAKLTAVNVVGYTDRIGPEPYNKVLSQQRAQTVKEELLASGVTAAQMQSIGRGSLDPVVNCPDTNTKTLSACLAPNRRVEVLADGVYRD